MLKIFVSCQSFYCGAMTKRTGARAMKNIFNAIIDEAPYISLICMLAICIGELIFVLHRPVYSVSALMLVLIIIAARFIPAFRNNADRLRPGNEEGGADKS